MSVLLDVLQLFLRLGLVAFGSGSSVLAEMDREVVARGWMNHEQFIQAFAVSQLTPGPQVLYTSIIGYFAAGYPGAVVATIAFCLPPCLLLLFLGTLWTRPTASPWPEAIRRSLRPVAIGLTGASSFALAPTALRAWWMLALAAVCFAVITLRPKFGPIGVIATGAVVGAAVGLLGFIS